MRTVLTGAAGYIGLHILRELLDNGHDVTAVVRSAAKLGPFKEHPRLTVVIADLDDNSRLTQVLSKHDSCVHAALIWGEPGSEFEMRDTAVAARLFNAAAVSGVARCVYLSSAAVHRPFSSVMHEDDCLITADLYGATKAAGELVLRAACAGHSMKGVVVRLGPVVGLPAFTNGSFRTPDRIKQMVVAAAEGRAIEVLSGDGRQFSDVRMVAKVVARLTNTLNPYPAYLCVDREIITWASIAQMVVHQLNSASELRILPYHGPTPRFQTDRLESLIGEPSNSEEALVAHIRHLTQTIDNHHTDDS